MKKAKKIAIIFAIVLLIGAGVFAALYYCTDLFKTPQDAFYSYVEKAAKIDNSKSFQEILDELKDSKEKSYKSEMSLGVEINSKNASSREAQQMAYLLKNLRLNINSNVKPSENKSTSNISLNLGGFDAANLKFVKDGDLYGIKVDEIDDEYLAVENNNLKDLLYKLGVKAENVPNKIESLDLYDLLYVSQEDQFKLEQTYKDIFKNNIPADRFTKQENVTQKINGEDVNTTVYKLSLSEEDFINLVVKLLETVKDDDTLLNIITEKFNKIIEDNVFDKVDVSTKISLPTTTKTKQTKVTQKISVNTIKEEIAKLLEELKAEKNYTEKSNAEVILYVSNNELAKMELKSNDEVQLAMEFFNKDDKKHIVFYAKERTYPNYGPYVDYRSMSSYRKVRETSELVKKMEIEYKTTKNGDSKTVDTGIAIFEEDEQVAKISFDITSKGKSGQGVNETSGKITLESEEGSFSLLINSKVEYTDDVDVESINNSNAQILNNMTEKELQEFKNSFEKGFINGYNDGASLFGGKSVIPETKNSLLENNEVEEEQEDLENRIKENQKLIEEKAEETKQNIEEKSKTDIKELERQMQELNDAMEKLKKSNS